MRDAIVHILRVLRDVFFYPAPEPYQSEASAYVAYQNTRRVLVFSMGLVCIHLVTRLPADVYHYSRLGDAFWTSPFGYRASVHAGFVCFLSMLSILVLWARPRRMEELQRWHRFLPEVFAGGVLLFTLTLSVVNQGITGSISTYLMGVAVVSVAVLLEDAVSLALYALCHIAFSILLPIVQPDPAIVLTHGIQSTAYSIGFWMLSRFLYSLHQRLFVASRMLDPQPGQTPTPQRPPALTLPTIVEARRARASLRQGDVVAHVDQHLDLLRDVAERRGIELRFEATVSPVVLPFDADKLELMLLHLTANALRAAPDRSTVAVTVDGRFQDRVEISIHDDGPALDGDVLSRLFDASGDGNRHPRQRSMAKAKALAEAQQATLTVASLPERGTTFTLRLPKRIG
ncbi:MAG: ATP-binding protein [Bacteroidota bacterium]